MNRLLLILAAALSCAAPAGAAERGIIFSQPDDGVYIVRHEGLSKALQDSDLLCADYFKRQQEADRVARASAAAPAKRTLQREKFAMVAAAQRAMGECLNADKLTAKALVEIFGAKKADRVQKAAPFEDLVYVQLPPDSSVYEALR